MKYLIVKCEPLSDGWECDAKTGFRFVSLIISINIKANGDMKFMKSVLMDERFLFKIGSEHYEMPLLRKTS